MLVIGSVIDVIVTMLVVVIETEIRLMVLGDSGGVHGTMVH